MLINFIFQFEKLILFYKCTNYVYNIIINLGHGHFKQKLQIRSTELYFIQSDMAAKM